MPITEEYFVNQTATLQSLLEVAPITLEEVQVLLIAATMIHFKGNKTHSAKALGVSIKTLRNKCHRYNISGKRAGNDNT